MVKNYSEIEARTIKLLARDGYGASSYLAINAYNDIFYKKNVEFVSKEVPELVFYFPKDIRPEKDVILAIRNEIIEISLLIEYLGKEHFITFLSSNSTNSLLSVGGFLKDGLQAVGLPIDKNIADILLACLNKEVIVSKSLKDLADELSISEPITERHYNSTLYFEKQRKQSPRSDLKDSVSMPKQLPGFVLCHNYDWDDNSYHNWYCLHYFDEHGVWTKIGELRLMHKDGESWPFLGDSFIHLSREYCSLGISLDFYYTMFSVFGKEMMEDILYALCDCSIDKSLYEQHKDKEQFKFSLCRDSIESERCLRLARFVMNGKSLENAFRFKYIYQPPYNTLSKTEWIVDLKPNDPSFLKCIGVIGENGVGKTRMLKQFIQDILSKNPENFPESIPVFSSIISICSTPFDSMMRLTGGDCIVKYTKCCLEQDLVKTEQVIKDAFGVISSRGRLNGESLVQLYISALSKELSTEKIDEVFVFHDSGIGILKRYELDEEGLHNLIYRLSSGQLHTMVLLSHIFQNIDYDSLFVIDEPEVHLHPNAILQFFRLINEVLGLFSSYAIIVTHSPLVVREMAGKNVFVLRRLENDTAYIGHCVHETFGEDISILYRDIFGYDESKSCFLDYMNSEIDKHPDYEELLDKLPIKNISLNARFYLRNLVAKRNGQ